MVKETFQLLLTLLFDLTALTLARLQWQSMDYSPQDQEAEEQQLST